MKDRLILSLCDYSGAWSRPYVDAGYRVVRVDTGHPPGESRAEDGAYLIGANVTRFELPWEPWGVLAAPPCTCFCRPASRWWSRQDASGDTARDVAVFRACLRLAKTARSWWAVENPPGRHPDLLPELGRPSWQFHPWQYGDPWAKQTYIWGTAAHPPVDDPVVPAATRRTPNGKTQGPIAFMSSSWQRQRSQTPAGFARAFFLANP